MSRIFNLENPFWQTMSKLGDIIMLNILWLVCCIPIITIGPSTTALYYVMLKRVRDEEGNIFQQFFRSFKLNFRQGAIVGIIMTVCGFLFLFDVMFYREAKGTVSDLFWFVSMMIFFVYLMVTIYIFPLIAKFENTVKNFFMFSFVMAVRHFGKTLIMALVTAGMIFLMYFVYPPLIFMFMGIIAYVNSKFLVDIFDMYIPDDKKEVRGQDQGFDEMEKAAAEGDAEDEPVHIVMDINNPEPVVLGEKKDDEQT